MLAPGEATEFQIVFMPREMHAYTETVRLELNGGYSIPIPVRGEGAALRVELASPAQQNVQFGNIRLGTTATRAVRIVNASKKAVRLVLKPGGQLVSAHDRVEAADEDASSASSSSAAAAAAGSTTNALDITFQPHPTAAAPLELRPRQSVELNIRYAPRVRMPAFVEELAFECEGMIRPLLRVAGACHGVGLAFEVRNISNRHCFRSKATNVISCMFQ